MKVTFSLQQRLKATEDLNFDVDYQGEYMVHKEIYIELQDTQWQFDYIDHDRNIARAIVYDENGNIMDKDTKGRPRNGGC